MKSKYPFLLCALTVLLSLACSMISSQGSPPRFEPESLPAARVGQAYEVEIDVSENDTPIGDFWVSKGALPAGLEFIWVERENTAKISGIPTEAGAFTFRLSLWCLGTNVSGEQGEKEYSIVVK